MRRSLSSPNKIVLLGEAGVGKSSLVNTFMRRPFTGDYISTIGIDFVSRTVQLEDGTTQRLQLWDTA